MNKKERKAWLVKNQNKIKKHIRLVSDEFKTLYLKSGIYSKKDEMHDKAVDAKTFKRYMKMYLEPTSNDAEVVAGINISKYLEKIRHLEMHEELLTLYIRNRKVVKQQRDIGSFSYVNTTERQLERILNTAKRLKADIYMVHNHPLSVHAKYSNSDLEFYYGVLLKNAKKRNIKVLDYGVVSFDDYCSLKKEDIVKARKLSQKNNKWIDEHVVSDLKEKERQKQLAKKIKARNKDIIRKESQKNREKYN